MRKLDKINFTSTDGLKCAGYLSCPNVSMPPCIIELPAGFTSSVVEASLGQDTFYSNLDNFLNSKGIAVFHIDRRGCMGYGPEFESKKDYGGLEVEDVLSGINQIRSSGLIDSNRTGIYGTCSSCIPALFALSRDPLSKFGLFVSGVFDLEFQANYETQKGFELNPIFRLMGVKKLEDFPYKERSPINYKLHINAPMMFCHGINDDVSDVEQSRKITEKLKTEGNRVKYLELESFPHKRSSSNPTTELGSSFWEETLSFMKEISFI